MGDLSTSMDLTPILWTAVIGQMVMVVFILFKTYPVMMNRVDVIEKTRIQDFSYMEQLRKIVEAHTVQMAQEHVERVNMKRDFDEFKQTMKDNGLLVGNKLEENTRAITRLEASIVYQLNRMNSNSNP